MRVTSTPGITPPLFGRGESFHRSKKVKRSYLGDIRQRTILYRDEVRPYMFVVRAALSHQHPHVREGEAAQIVETVVDLDRLGA
jgi:hypothetical protein